VPEQSERPLPSDCRGFDAINPFDGTLWKVYVRDSAMDRAVKLGPGAVRELGFTVPESVLKPSAVFRGVRDEGEPGWLCYAAGPARMYSRATGESRRPPVGKVFLVLFDEYRIFRGSEWELADPNDATLPNGHESRFDERLL
jgi:hypothetical protein